METERKTGDFWGSRPEQVVRTPVRQCVLEDGHEERDGTAHLYSDRHVRPAHRQAYPTWFEEKS